MLMPSILFRGDIILPGIHAKNVTGFVDQGKSVAEGEHSSWAQNISWCLLNLGPIYAGPVSAAGWTVPDQDISERHSSTRPSDCKLNVNLS